MRITEGQLRRIIREELERTQLLSESELRWTPILVQRVKEFFIISRASRITSKTFYISPWDILYLDSPKIKNGAVVVEYLHNTKSTLAALQALTEKKEAWNSETRTFNPDWAVSALAPFRFGVVLDHLRGHAKGAFTIDGTGEYYLVVIDPAKITSDRDLEKTVKHELQHMTQALNTLALDYGEQILRSGGDLSKIEKRDLEVGIKNQTVGQPATRTRLVPVTPREAEALKLTSDEVKERYFGSDVEYETWTTMLADDLSSWIINKMTHSKTVNQLLEAVLKEIVDEKGLPATMPKFQAVAKKFEVTVDKLVARTRRASTLNHLAITAVNLLLNDPVFEANFDSSVDVDYQPSIKVNMKYRRREFVGDLVTKLEESLRAVVEKWLA